MELEELELEKVDVELAVESDVVLYISVSSFNNYLIRSSI